MDASQLQQFALYSFAAVGSIYLASKTLSLLNVLTAPLLIGSKLSKYLEKDSYAVVTGKSPMHKLLLSILTGASEGIGREFSLQLAKKGFNLVILSRTKTNLDLLSEELKRVAPKSNVVVFPFDFAKATPAKYSDLSKTLDGLKVSVLVNNVAMNHSIPTPFMEECEVLIDNIVKVNISATMAMTRLVLSQMLLRKNGLVINIGSLSGQVPSAYLSVYAASKAYLRSWSQAVAMEVKSQGVHIEHLNTYFVTTAMSKIRKPTFTTPSPKQYVASVLSRVGNHIHSIPYFSHALLGWILEFANENMLLQKSADMHLSIRKRALKKKEREIKKDE